MAAPAQQLQLTVTAKIRGVAVSAACRKLRRATTPQRRRCQALRTPKIHVDHRIRKHKLISLSQILAQCIRLHFVRIRKRDGN